MTRQITLTDTEFVETRDAISDAICNAKDVLTDLLEDGTRSDIREQRKHIATLRRVLEKLRES